MAASRRGIWAASCLAPWGLCILLTARYGYDVPFWDQWWLLQLIQKTFDGTVSVGDLWITVNEHRVFFPNMVTVALARLSHWNLYFELAFDLCLATATFLLIAWLVLRTEKTCGKRGPLWVLALISVLAFSWGQWRNWTWGLHLIIFMSQFLAVGTILLLAMGKPGRLRFGAACLLAVTATYSFGPGVAIWPTGLAILLYHGVADRKEGALRAGIWVITAALTMAVYFIEYEATETNQRAIEALLSPVSFAAYLGAYIGAPLFSYSAVAALVAGAAWCVLFALSAWALTRNPDVPKGILTPFWGLALFAFGVAVLTGFKHAHEGFEHALASRFMTWGTLFWVALAAQVYFCALFARRKTPVHTLCILVAVCTAASWAYGAYKADEHHDAFLIGRAALISGKNDADLRWLYPDPAKPKADRKILVDYKLTVFRE